jgi:hypothetical protein
LAPGVYEAENLSKLYPQLLGNESPTIVYSRCMKLISRELILNNLKYSHDKLKSGEDMNIIIPALLSARRLVIMEDAYFYHYFYNTESMVHIYDAGLYNNNRLLYEVMRNIFMAKVEDGTINLTSEEIEEQCGREYVLLLLSALRNEARGSKIGHEYRKKVREICRDEKNRKLVKQYPVKVSEPQNRLLYMVLKYPCGLTFWMLRIATYLFYKILR